MSEKEDNSVTSKSGESCKFDSKGQKVNKTVVMCIIILQ